MSGILLALYEMAAQTSLHDFPGTALRLLHPGIQFDSAALGAAEAAPGFGLAISDACIEGRPQSLVDDYLQVWTKAPIVAAFLNGLSRPLQCDCRLVHQDDASFGPDGLSRTYRFHHVMLYGDAPGADAAGRWIVFYKESGASFAPIEEARLQHLWPHLARALAVNRAANLERLDATRAHRAFALLDRGGAVASADPQFLALLQREWPQQGATRLPPPALQRLLERRIYRGRQIEITAMPQHGHLACKAQALENSSEMTPAEYAVARRFAQGLSHKEVAREQGVSHHTVRTQLAHVYEKLGIHDKAALAAYLLTSLKQNIS